MKIIVFGATGGTGRQVVERALAQGHTVTAFVRNPDKFTLNHENLAVTTGNVMNETAVENAIRGVDAVMCTLGAGAMNRDRVRTRGTQTIIKAMQKTCVKRLVCQSSIGVGDSRRTAPCFYRYFIFPIVLRHPLADHEAQEFLIKQSTLDWTIVRPGNLTDEAPTGSYRHGVGDLDASLTLKVSRADVADFMIKQLNEDTYRHKAPFLSN